jgi:hypothetical protein
MGSRFECPRCGAEVTGDMLDRCAGCLRILCPECRGDGTCGRCLEESAQAQANGQ